MSNAPAELELAETRVAASTASVAAQGQALKLKVRRLVTSPFVNGGLVTVRPLGTLPLGAAPSRECRPPVLSQ